jgi:hypothetical protein
MSGFGGGGGNFSPSPNNINGDATVSGNSTVSGDMTVNGSAVFNEGSLSTSDFRVESNHATHMIFVDSSSNRIGIANNSPQNLLDIKDPFHSLDVAFAQPAVLALTSRKEVGIKLIADSDNVTEVDNPYIDFYTDGSPDTSGRSNRKASLAMEGAAGTTFTESLENAFFLDAFVPNSTPSSLRPFQIATDSSGDGHKARITIEGTNGYLGINTNAPTQKLDINSDMFRLRTAKTPASAAATGDQGTIAWDTNYIYICVATDTWKRVAISTF